MPAAAVPIASSFLAPALADTAGTALAGTALGTLASSAPWLLPAITGAGLGGIGSLLTGQDPLRGALFGGVGGGIGSAINGGNGLGSLFGGSGVNPSAADTAGALSSAGPSEFANAPGIDLSFDGAGTGAATSGLYNAPGAASQFASSVASPSASSGLSGLFSGNNLSHLLPFGAAGASLLADQMTKPKQVGPTPQASPSNPGPVSPLVRQTQTVDPNSYFTSGGNRNFYSPYSMQPQFMAKGGPIKQPQPIIGINKYNAPGLGGGLIANPANRNPTPYPVTGRKRGVVRMYAGGGSASDSASNVPMMRGQGDGQSDSIPAMLSDGEFIVSAPVVSALGGGSNNAGAKKLSMMQKNVIRKHYTGGKPKKPMGLGSYMH